MTNIFYMMGKSACGKDTIYKKLKEKMPLKEYLLYVTRPIRDGEKDGVDYHFVTTEQMDEYRRQGRIVESRTYNTVHGPWTYATINDDQLNQEGDILTVGTLESYNMIKEYFKKNKDTRVIPIYIKISEEERRKRAIAREKRQKEPKYEEMERRMKADNIDFSPEKIKEAGITEKETFENDDADTCAARILEYMRAKKLSASKDEASITNNKDMEEER